MPSTKKTITRHVIPEGPRHGGEDGMSENSFMSHSIHVEHSIRVAHRK
jgi:hypothetical protein